MSGVDDRVVSMQFDNAQFEQNIAQTMKSLDKFQETLKLADATRGLENVQAASSRFSMGGLSDGVDHVSAKFLALATIGLTALSNITSAAMSAGLNFVKSFTLGPVIDGFHEFETNMNSIQTILANTKSKGSTLDQVNASLQDLNVYSDKTIYNFTQMAQNIGTFTAAGVGLDTATQSIKGIANLAALSGASALDASTAMYQLSQAIASGTVRLQDWMSVEHANIGGEIFQKSLFETGKALGTLKNVPMSETFEQWKKSVGSFRQSLSDTASGASEVDKAAQAQKDSAEKVAETEQRAADSIEAANKRVITARDDAAQTAKDNAKDIADATKTQIESATKNAEAITSAEKNQSDVFERVAKDIAAAVDNQNKTLAEGAANVQKALDTVVEAQHRLEEAMKPESTDKLQAATDRLTTAQLDQADLSDAIVLAQREQQRGAEDLAAARQALIDTENNGKKSAADLQAARRRVEDAETREVDLADAVERARLKQNAAIRNVTDAENQLTVAKQKGTEEDQNVIDATKAVEDAQKAVLTAREEAAQKDIAAAQNVKDVELAADESKKQAIDAVSKARDYAAKSQEESIQRMAELTERDNKRQIDATQRVTDSEKEAAKAQIDATKQIAKAHEEAAKQIQAASEGTAKTGWLTSKVLTTALSAFTGDMTKEQLMAAGYTETQAKEMKTLGELGTDSATKVKTLTQLISTVKEAIGSGWTNTFQILFGNFNDSLSLFTTISKAIGDLVTNSANLRNSMFKDWADMGGRTILIKAFGDAIHGLSSIIAPIREAFRDIFPKKTSEDLLHWTKMFATFAEHLKIGANTADELKRGFKGIFSVIEIGWTIAKEFFSLIGDLFGAIGGALGASTLETFAKMGDYLTNLDRKMVTLGGIHDFFLKIRDAIGWVIDNIGTLTTKVQTFFDSFGAAKVAEEGVDRVGSRFDNLSKAFDKLEGFFDKVKAVFDKIWSYIADWFKDLGNKIAASMKPGDFDSAVDVMNVGLLGGIGLMLKKFISGGLNLNFSTGILGNLQQTFKQLTGVLQSMQTQLKAKALEEIAIAIGVLTASLLVLSLIDSAALAKALTAMAVGFGELVGTMEMMDKIGGGSKDAAKLGVLSGSMIAIASAAVVLAGAIAILGHMDAADLAKGIVGITAGLDELMIVVKNLGDNKGVIAASVAMVAISGAMVVLAGAVKLFSMMSWEDMTKGLIGVGAALGIVVLAMNAMPGGALAGVGMAAAGAGMVLMATGLTIMAGAVKLFSMLSAGDMAKGLVGMAIALDLIVVAMEEMPLTLPITAAGLLIMAIALNTLVPAIEILGHMKMGELAKGLGGLAALLLIISLGMVTMEEALPGAVATVVAAGALAVLAEVIEKLGKMSIKELAIGLGAIAAVFLVLGVAGLVLGPIIPILLGLGIALGLVGVAFILFGAGAYLAAKAFEIIAEAGKAGVGAIIDAIVMFIKAIPRFVSALIDSLTESADEFLKAGTLLVKLATVFLGQLLDTIILLAPKIALAIVAIITSALVIIREKIPDIVETGFVVLMALLQGLKDHIIEVTNLAVDIIVKFAATLTDNASKLVDAAVNLLLAFTEAIAKRAGDIAGAGLGVVIALAKGMTDNAAKIIEAVASIISTLVTAIGNAAGKIVDAGATTVVKFIEGLGRDAYKVINAGVALLVSLMEGVGSNALYVANKGAQIVIDFINGVADMIRKKEPQLILAFANLADAMIEGLIQGIKDGAKKLGGPFGSVLGGIINFAYDKFESHSPSRVFLALGKSLMDGLGIGIQRDKSAQAHVVTQAEKIVLAFQESLNRIPDSLAGMKEFNPVITPVLDLTKIQSGARTIDDLMKVSAISPDVSIDNARVISVSTTASSDTTVDTTPTAPTEVKFEQNIYAPKELATNDIYRSTKSQIVMAKEELNIP